MAQSKVPIHNKAQIKKQEGCLKVKSGQVGFSLTIYVHICREKPHANKKAKETNMEKSRL